MSDLDGAELKSLFTSAATEDEAFDAGSMDRPLSIARPDALSVSSIGDERQREIDRRIQALIGQAKGLDQWTSSDLERLADSFLALENWPSARATYQLLLDRALASPSAVLSFGPASENVGRLSYALGYASLKITKRDAGGDWERQYRKIAQLFERGACTKIVREQSLSGLVYCLAQLSEETRAIEVARKCADEFPDSVQAVLVLAHSLIRANALDEAGERLEHAQQFSDSPLLAHTLGFWHLRSRSPAQALEHFERALSLDPLFSDASVQAGICLLVLRRHEEALSRFDHAIRLEARNPSAHYNRARLLKNLNREEEALTSIDHALAARPNYPVALWLRGELLRSSNRFPEALAALDTAVNLSPTNGAMRAYLAMLLSTLGEREAANTHYEAALAYSPTDYMVQACRAENLAHLGQRTDAAQAAAQLLKQLAQLTPAVARRLQTTMVLIGDYAGCLAVLERLSLLFPEDSEILYRKSATLFKLSRPREAFDCARRALALRPDRLDYRKQFAWTALAAEEFVSAAKMYADLCNESPTDTHLLHNYGNALFGLRRFCDAADCYGQVLALDPTREGSRVRLSRANAGCAKERGSRPRH